MTCDPGSSFYNLITWGKIDGRITKTKERIALFMMRILIVEDDQTISSLITEHLKKWGYEAYQTEEFKNVLLEFEKIKPHIVLLDINLPYYDGFYWCEKIRKLSTVPIVFISSRGDDTDKIRGITGGADDYIEKPLSLEVLVAKIQGILRRTYAYADLPNSTLSYSNMILDLEKNIVGIDNTEINLTTNECKILSLLFKGNSRIISREEIMRSLWNDERFIDDNTLTVNINRLRSKFKDSGINNIIETVKGKGYKLI